MQMYEYQIVVPEKRDNDGFLLRPAQLIVHVVGAVGARLEEIKREDLLVVHAGLIARAGATKGDVSIRIRAYPRERAGEDKIEEPKPEPEKVYVGQWVWSLDADEERCKGPARVTRRERGSAWFDCACGGSGMTHLSAGLLRPMRIGDRVKVVEKPSSSFIPGGLVTRIVGFGSDGCQPILIEDLGSPVPWGVAYTDIRLIEEKP